MSRVADKSDFWSRRKARVEAEQAAEAKAQEAVALEQAEAEKTDDELLAELGLPEPESLETGDDFSAFMAKTVPQRLRTRALRKLWLTNPTLANLDELVDYGQDFTDSAMAVENIQTAYQVGKGMLTHVQKMAEQALGTDEPEMAEPEEVLEVAETAPEEAPVEMAAAPEPESDTEHDDYAPAPRRRMRFDFDDAATA
ncbi:uncharacterized protein DUF3306 [Litoreibacter ponti]|uniref:Uncharacterized protein DUF3306 n=1 Tax=Litoreibacter ponti TaxID=1510457 RepID=A0A2T6BEV5_9RHOB|nr:DUF3306 domain-containing protein [Litoreibacter ponti]PTX54602.1 uncharacterized protein DUF3306 [Litoreibacter ponti]